MPAGTTLMQVRSASKPYHPQGLNSEPKATANYPESLSVSAHMTILQIAWLIFVVNFLYGVLVASGVVERGRWRKIHHFLYLLTILGILAAIAVALLDGRSLPVPLAVMALLLLGMSRFGGGGRAHAAYATICLVVY